MKIVRCRSCHAPKPAGQKCLAWGCQATLEKPKAQPKARHLMAVKQHGFHALALATR